MAEDAPRKKPGPPKTGQRLKLAVRMWPSGLAALDERLAAVQARCKRLGITPAPTRSDLVRWAVVDMHRSKPADWLPESVVREKKP